MTPSVSYSVNQRIGTILIESPPVNALSHSVRSGILERLKMASTDDTEIIILRCEGRTFIAGADISEFGKPPQEPSLATVLDALESFPKPILAAIHGTALGGGLELALCCDYRLAIETAKVGLPEVNLGLLPGAGGTQRLAQLVGEGWAKRMILCGERVSANKAMTLGLVEEVVEPGSSLATAFDLAKRASDQSPTSIAACKRLIHSARDIAIGAGLLAERDEFVALFSTEDQKEGVNAFLEKRAPEWKNR